jgi:hypothetical protein
MTTQSIARVHSAPGWLQGSAVGLAAAAVGTLALITVGTVSGRGLDILAAVGMGPWPSAVRALTGASPAVSYLISHTTLYLLAGIVGLALARVADRTPVLLTGLLLLIIVVEFGFLFVMTGWQAAGRFDQVTWRAVVIAHAVADIVLVLGIVRVHPSLRQALRRAYQE